jgi:hypothetical protein
VKATTGKKEVQSAAEVAGGGPPPTGCSALLVTDE